MVKELMLLLSVIQYKSTLFLHSKIDQLRCHTVVFFYYLSLFYDLSLLFLLSSKKLLNILCAFCSSVLPRILLPPNPTRSPASFPLSWVQVSLPPQRSGHWVIQIADAAGCGRCWNSVVVPSQHCLRLEFGAVAHWPAQAALYGGFFHVLTRVVITNGMNLKYLPTFLPFKKKMFKRTFVYYW